MDLALCCLFLACPCEYGAVLIADLVCVTVPFALCGNETVAHEGCVARVLVIVVASERENVVGAVFLCVRRLVKRLVHKIPDAAALERRIFADKVPVFLEASHGVAHRVRVFAHYERTVLVFIDVLLGIGVADVHRSEDVGVAIPVRSALSLLVLYRAGGVEGFGEVVGIIEVLSVAGLVSETPDDD